MKAMRVAWGETLAELAGEYPELVVLDGDLANSTRADLFDAAYPDRFFEMGIAEQNLVGAAAGMAHTGLIPWLSSFAVFFTHRAADPLRMLVAQTRANVKIGAAYAGLLTGYTGKTHQDVEDLAIMRAMPGMTVLAPADAAECRAMTRWATAYQGPVYLRLTRDPSPEVFPEGQAFIPGEPVMVRPEGKVALVSTGTQTSRALSAARELAERGIEVRVVHVGSLKPLKPQAVGEVLAGVELVVSVEEHSVYGGLGGALAEILSELSPKRLVRLGIQDHFGESGDNDYLLERYGLSPTRLAERVEEEVARWKR